MKRLLFFTVLSVMFILSTQAQSLSQTVMGNSGATLSGGSGTLSFTLGEPVIGSISSGATLDQGFWAGAIQNLILDVDDFSLEGSTTVFPNPVRDQLNLSFNELQGEWFDLKLYDLNGRLIFSQELQNLSGEASISMSQLQAGVYLLQVNLTEQGGSKTFKIIKQ
ncbi:T9SS type A sorting domain-containing protein [Gilvibacter sp.]|uniref:T9SS type A sorting domain-containing protein n=1 Tax=Gilvibacter sp. TaxID=2729997 RepID=UPI003F4A37EA